MIDNPITAHGLLTLPAIRATPKRLTAELKWRTVTPRLRRRGEPLAQLVFHHLAGGIARELVDEMQHPWALVVGESLGTELQQCRLIERAARLAHHERADVLA